MSYTTRSHTTFTLNSESSYDWNHNHWSIPINLMAAQLVKVGGLPMQFQLGVRYYAETTSTGPEWGLRSAIVLLLPKG